MLFSMEKVPRTIYGLKYNKIFSDEKVFNRIELFFEESERNKREKELYNTINVLDVKKIKWIIKDEV